MSLKIIINSTTCECPNCGYRWSRKSRLSMLRFDKDLDCYCCPECGEGIKDGKSYQQKGAISYD